MDPLFNRIIGKYRKQEETKDEYISNIELRIRELLQIAKVGYETRQVTQLSNEEIQMKSTSTHTILSGYGSGMETWTFKLYLIILQ